MSGTPTLSCLTRTRVVSLLVGQTAIVMFVLRSVFNLTTAAQCGFVCLDRVQFLSVRMNCCYQILNNQPGRILIAIIHAPTQYESMRYVLLS